MLPVKTNRQLAVFSLLLVVLISAAAFWQWWALQSAQLNQAQLSKQLMTALRHSETQTVQLQQKLALLQQQEAEPPLQEYTPVEWLAALQSAIDDVRASVLVNKVETLSEFQGLELVRVPIELELRSANSSVVVQALNAIDASLGTHTSVESCLLSNRQRQGVNDGYRVRCRLLKYAYRGAIL